MKDFIKEPALVILVNCILFGDFEINSFKRSLSLDLNKNLSFIELLRAKYGSFIDVKFFYSYIYSGISSDEKYSMLLDLKGNSFSEINQKNYSNIPQLNSECSIALELIRDSDTDTIIKKHACNNSGEKSTFKTRAKDMEEKIKRVKDKFNKNLGVSFTIKIGKKKIAEELLKKYLGAFFENKLIQFKSSSEDLNKELKDYLEYSGDEITENDIGTAFTFEKNLDLFLDYILSKEKQGDNLKVNWTYHLADHLQFSNSDKSTLLPLFKNKILEVLLFLNERNHLKITKLNLCEKRHCVENYEKFWSLQDNNLSPIGKKSFFEQKLKPGIRDIVGWDCELSMLKSAEEIRDRYLKNSINGASKIIKVEAAGFTLYELKNKSYLAYKGKTEKLTDATITEICTLMLHNLGKTISNETLREIAPNSKDPAISKLRKIFKRLGEDKALITKRGKGILVNL